MKIRTDAQAAQGIQESGKRIRFSESIGSCAATAPRTPMANNFDQARRFIHTAPPAVSGNGGHNTTFRVACDLIHGFGLSDDEALKLLGEYNTRLEEQWTNAELRHKIEGASQSLSRRPIGYLLARHGPYKRTPLAPPAQRTTWKITRRSPPPPRSSAPAVSQNPGVAPDGDQKGDGKPGTEGLSETGQEQWCHSAAFNLEDIAAEVPVYQLSHNNSI